MDDTLNVPKKIYITKNVFHQIEKEIAGRQPEQGGALLGPPEFPAVTRFVYDPWAQTTGASYVPSDELIDRVPKIEQHESLEFKGIIHSHPAGIGRPSSQDIHGPFTRALNENSHLTYFLGPIFTHSSSALDRESHHLKCGNGTVAFYIASRGGSNIRVEPIYCQVVTVNKLDQMLLQRRLKKATTPNSFPAIQQLHQDLKMLVKTFNIEPELALVPMEIDQRNVLGVQIPLSSTIELTMLIGETYPITPPIAIVSETAVGSHKQLEQLHLKWDFELPPQDRLVTALREFFPQQAPQKKTYGPIGTHLLTDDPVTAQLAGWKLSYTRGAPESESLYAELLKRSTGILSQTIASKHVLVVGLGSVGSYVSELLVRSGVGKLTLVDPEVVEAVNLSRTVYEVGDIGRSKVDALARRLLNISPVVDLSRHLADLTDLSPERVHRLVNSADLILAATDSLEAQRALNRFAYACGKPAVFIGIYAAANGGEVIYVLPERTSCYQCATRSRSTLGEATPGMDYGSEAGRLVSEIALAADIQHISSTAEKVALSLLLLDDTTESKLKDFIGLPVSQGRNFIAFSNAPNFWVFPDLLSGAHGQHAYQSLWMRIEKQPKCQVCGDERKDPMSVSMKSPDIPVLQKLHEAHRKPVS